MLINISDLYKHYDTCKKRFNNLLLSESLILGVMVLLTKVGSKNFVQCQTTTKKICIICEINFCACYPVAQAVPKHIKTSLEGSLARELLEVWHTQKNANILRLRI